MALFETIRGWELGGEGPAYVLTPEDQLRAIQQQIGDPNLTEADLLRRVALAPDKQTGDDLLQAIQVLGTGGRGPFTSGLDPTWAQTYADRIRNAPAELPSPEPAPPPAAVPGAAEVPGGPRLGQGVWEGNTFLPPADPPRPGTEYPRRSPEGFLPGRMPAALQLPPLADFFGALLQAEGDALPPGLPSLPRLLRQGPAARSRLLAR